jgi:hypothetical protein
MAGERLAARKLSKASCRIRHERGQRRRQIAVALQRKGRADRPAFFISVSMRLRVLPLQAIVTSA